MNKNWLTGLFVLLLGISSFSLQDDEITFFLVGDSTLANKPYGESNPEKGWGQVFPLYFEEGIRFENHAVNGRSAKSFRAEGRWDEVMDRLKPGDYVLVQFGHNDQKENSPDRYAEADTEYRQRLTQFVEEIRAKGGKAVLATSICRRKFDENGELEYTHGRYPEVVREVAKEFDVRLFDLEVQTAKVLKQFGPEKSKELFLHYRPGDYAQFPKGASDDTHLSPTGAFKVSDLAVEELKRELPELAGFLKN